MLQQAAEEIVSTKSVSTKHDAQEMSFWMQERSRPRAVSPPRAVAGQQMRRFCLAVVVACVAAGKRGGGRNKPQADELPPAPVELPPAPVDSAEMVALPPAPIAMGADAIAAPVPMAPAPVLMDAGDAVPVPMPVPGGADAVPVPVPVPVPEPVPVPVPMAVPAAGSPPPPPPPPPPPRGRPPPIKVTIKDAGKTEL